MYKPFNQSCIYPQLIIDIINDNHIEYIRSECPEAFELMRPHGSDP